MEIFTQKYCIVSLLEDRAEGYEYSSSKWPLHVTIADTFSIEWDIDALVTELKNMAKDLNPVFTKGVGDKYFGPDKNIQVTLLEKNPELIHLHYQIIGLLKRAGVKFNDPQYSDEGFLPHSTVQLHTRVKIGEIVQIRNLALIDMFPDKDAYSRKILSFIEF